MAHNSKQDVFALIWPKSTAVCTCAPSPCPGGGSWSHLFPQLVSLCLSLCVCVSVSEENSS